MRAFLILIAVVTVLAPVALAAKSVRPADLEGHLILTLPPGAEGPVPAVLMFPGCGGVQPLQEVYGQAAHQAGWAAITVDSHGARGINRLGARLLVCTALRMRGGERAGDVFAALDLARADPRLDADRMAVIGWSHGGWAILDAMAIAAEGSGPETGEGLHGVEAAILLYPYCGFLSRADTGSIGTDIPVTMTVVGRDRVVSAQACRELAADRRAEGAAITLIEEPELTHAFDAEVQAADPRMRYDAEGAARALDHFVEALGAAGEG